MDEPLWFENPALRAATVRAKKEHAEAKENGRTEWKEANPLVCKPLEALPIGCILPRPWAYGKFLMFSTAAAIGAVDGAGKGAHAVAILLSMITGRELLGERVWRTGKVAIITYEDDELEWRRRIAAACLHYGPKLGLDYDAVIENVYFISRSAGRVSLATAEDGQVVFPDSGAIIDHLKAIGAVLLIVDPFNHAHGLSDGNSNALIAKVGHEIVRIAQQSEVAVLVLHHLRKGAVGDPDDFMGAVALRATFRAVRILARMLPEQGEKLQIPRKQVWRYSRVAGSKENYAPPPSFTTWYKLESVDLGNPDSLYTDGDNVAVVTLWTPPSAFEGLKAKDVAEIFDALRIPPGDQLKWSPDQRSTEWAGKAIMKATGKDAHQASEIVHRYIDNEVLSKGEYMHPKLRKLRSFVAVNEAKASEMVDFVYWKPDTE